MLDIPGKQTVGNSTQLEQLIPDCWYEVDSKISGTSESVRFIKLLCVLSSNKAGMTHALLLRNGLGNETVGEWNNSTFNASFSDVREVEILFATDDCENGGTNGGTVESIRDLVMFSQGAGKTVFQCVIS
ncbi:hypothetical protein ACFPVS_02675 [Neisseria weixii]|uniref:hypothetical protein n=1 Tax=Neisseria weixii TaxID=1853276 RepID=UPI000BB8046F|nr:hypothetical protein [Neisseria weixii]ATD64964.1 hypothetical protein CGZ65_05835 [Neisseria weixii]